MTEIGQAMIGWGWFLVVIGTICSIVATCWAGSRQDSVEHIDADGNVHRGINLYWLFPVATVLLVAGFILGKIGTTV